MDAELKSAIEQKSCPNQNLSRGGWPLERIQDAWVASIHLIIATIREIGDCQKQDIDPKILA